MALGCYSMIGITMGEIFYLRDLAKDCDEDKVYEFFFCAPPLPITKAVGSPINLWHKITFMKPSRLLLVVQWQAICCHRPFKKRMGISVHEKVPVPLSGRGAGIATYDELADLVFKATNNNNVLGTTAKSRVSLDINGKIINSYDYPQVYTSWQYLFSILREQISNDDYFMGDDCIKIEQNEHKAIAFLKMERKKKLI